jgi:SulP family sulfate permease
LIAIVEAARVGLLRPPHWMRNVVSGVIVGVVALPLAMAFAIASGAKPEQGLYTAIIAGLLVSVLGGTRLQIAGPTGAFVVILAGITATHGIEGLQIATLMAGVMLLALGAARLGGVIRFIPDPVIVGFTAGIGLIIFVGQWPAFFGLPAVGGTHFHEKLWQLVHALRGIHVSTTAIAVLSLVLAIFGARLLRMPRLPGPLLALVAATALQSHWQFEGVATIGSAFGGIPQGLPSFGLPEITGAKLIELIGPAFAIAMLGAIESLLSAVVADGMAGTRHDSNQELVGQGIANIVAPLFGGFAATGAIARTATNVRNGGNSPLSGMVHAVTLLAIILFLAPLASAIPLCTLAAILFVVAWNMSEVHRFARMVREAPRADVVILVITFLLTVFADLVLAVNIGVIIATLLFMRRMASTVEARIQTAQDLHSELGALGATRLPPTLVVCSIEGPLFFGAVDSVEHVLEQTRTGAKVFLIRLKHVPFMDITGLQTLEDAITGLQQRGVQVMLSEANLRVTRKLLRTGIIRRIGRAHYHRDLADALRAAGVAPEA